MSFLFRFFSCSLGGGEWALAILEVTAGIGLSAVSMLVRIAREATRAARRLTHAKPPTRHKATQMANREDVQLAREGANSLNRAGGPNRC